jgi:phosphoadenosine phosphosulfate reductase
MTAIASDRIEQLAADLEASGAEEVLRWGIETFGDGLALSSAFLVEDMAVLDIAHRIDPSVRVFTLDTGRLPQETYDLMDEVRSRYGIEIEVQFPDAGQVEWMVRRHGLNLMYRDKANRLLCCQVRKVFPLEKALAGLDAWATGLRREQNVTRVGVRKVELDAAHGDIVKINPIADWTKDDVWSYIQANNVPHSKLYDAGYTSIGCAPCTRAIKPGEPDRAGRWWWEDPDSKECGLHAQSPDERFQEELALIREIKRK